MNEQENIQMEAPVNVQKPVALSPIKPAILKKLKKNKKPMNPSYYNVLDDDQIESIQWKKF